MTTAQNQTFDSARPADIRGEARRLAASMPFPAKALTVAAGFVVFPPLGLATLAYFIYQSRRGWRDGEQGAPAFAGRRMGRCGHRHGGRFHREGSMTGNSAMDEKRRETLRALDEEAEAFAEFRRKERETRDRESFDRFMKGRDSGVADSATKG